MESLEPIDNFSNFKAKALIKWIFEIKNIFDVDPWPLLKDRPKSLSSAYALLLRVIVNSRRYDLLRIYSTPISTKLYTYPSGSSHCVNVVLYLVSPCRGNRATLINTEKGLYQWLSDIWLIWLRRRQQYHLTLVKFGKVTLLLKSNVYFYSGFILFCI